MIYLVTLNKELFNSEYYKIITATESLQMMSEWNVIQVDSETNGRDSHICDFLCCQFGNKKANAQIVVDTSCIDIKLYKELLESKPLIFQNAKFDLQFLYNYHIIPMKVYDTMIIEQLLYLGYPYLSLTPEEYTRNKYNFPFLEEITKEGNTLYNLSFSLKAIALKRLNIDIDKTVRGEIIWRGLDTSVILYAAGDVMYLEDIMESQLADLKKQDLMKAAQIENQFVPVIAYLEWCGIYLNQDLWKTKMKQDAINLEESKKALDDFVLNNPILSKFTKFDLQGDLFSGFDDKPKCIINWSSSQQVVQVAKIIGFDTTVQDKKTGEDKDSVLEKHLKSQKGINDTFLKLYFDYQGFNKVVTSFGQGHLNAINPKTGRIHTVFRQLGAASGRMSCGSQQANTDLAKLNGISPKDCTYPNIQQLPADDATRGAFTNQLPDTLICSSDFSALESRLGGDIYNEKAIIDEFTKGSGDMHSLVAKACFPKELEGIEVKDIKKLRPDLRKKAKGPEFAMQFGGSPMAIQSSLGCPIEEAEEIADAYWKGFPGVAKFKEQGSKFVRSHGYVLMCKYSGHKMYWWDWENWKKVQARFNELGFWDEYTAHHKGTGDAIALEVKAHFQSASKWDRMALNAPTQGSGCVILKMAMRKFFEWILANNYFNIVKLCALVHDEAVIEYPKDIDAPTVLKQCMEDAAAIICKSMPIPSVPESGNHWIH